MATRPTPPRGAPGRIGDLTGVTCGHPVDEGDQGFDCARLVGHEGDHGPDPDPTPAGADPGGFRFPAKAFDVAPGLVEGTAQLVDTFGLTALYEYVRAVMEYPEPPADRPPRQRVLRVELVNADSRTLLDAGDWWTEGPWLVLNYRQVRTIYGELTNPPEVRIPMRNIASFEQSWEDWPNPPQPFDNTLPADEPAAG